MARDLHQALKTDIIEKSSDAGCNFMLVRMQWTKAETAVGLHVNPTTFSTAGLQTTDLLSLLGFEHSRCTFFPGGGCFARLVPEDFDLEAFGKRFGQAFDKLDKSDRDLQACGYALPQPEGWGYFFGKSTYRDRRPSWTGDGHTAGKIEQMKSSEDATFNFRLTWIDGGTAGKGWSIHYRPKHPPASAEIDGIFDFLGVKTFDQCPQFDFEPCYYRFIPYEAREEHFFGSNAQAAHNAFDMHATKFSLGIANLLEAHTLMEKSGFTLLPFPEKRARHRQEIQSRVIRPKQPSASATPKTPFVFDAAISFAGTNRKQAEELATRIREAGFSVFYDEFYPEDLWGKDLTVYFDEVFRKQSRYCVMFVSNEYLQRPWTIHERRSAMARAIEERGREYILPIKVDDVELPGLPPTVGYIPISTEIPKIADILIKKLRIAVT